MTKDPEQMIEDYVAACFKEEQLLNIAEIAKSEHLEYGEGPVYNHFGGIGAFQFAAFAEVFSWTVQDQSDFLEKHDLHAEDIRRFRR